MADLEFPPATQMTPINPCNAGVECGGSSPAVEIDFLGGEQLLSLFNGDDPIFALIRLQLAEECLNGPHIASEWPLELVCTLFVCEPVPTDKPWRVLAKTDSHARLIPVIHCAQRSDIATHAAHQ